ncbi:MAG: hypothetical protein ACK4FF_03615 [Limnobacter sp.]|uniref:hypothetical protein n=1 Tax=Limnobacter sp. TaxID=2003368 RepID=UPI0039193AAE
MKRIAPSLSERSQASDSTDQTTADNLKKPRVPSRILEGAEQLGRELVIAATGTSTSVVTVPRGNGPTEEKRLIDLWVDNPDLAQHQMECRAKIEAAKNAKRQALRLNKAEVLNEQINNWHTRLRAKPDKAENIRLSNEQGYVEVTGLYRRKGADDIWRFSLKFDTMNSGEKTLETMRRLRLFEFAELGAQLNLDLKYTSLPATLLAGEVAADDSPQWTLPAAIQENFNSLDLQLPLPYQLDNEPTEHSVLKTLNVQLTDSFNAKCESTLKIPAGVETLMVRVPPTCPKGTRFTAPKQYPESLRTLSLMLGGLPNPRLVNLHKLPPNVQNLTLILDIVSTETRNDALCAALGRAGTYHVKTVELRNWFNPNTRTSKVYSSGINHRFDWPNEIKTKGMEGVSRMCENHSLQPVLVESWPWVREALEAHQAQASS